MRILVCGGRDFTDYDLLKTVLNEVYWLWLTGDRKWPFVLIQGGARGTDTLARNWANAQGCIIHEFLADWEKYGKAAGPIRNQQMLIEGQPDLVIAFPGGRGTADMVSKAREAGVKVEEIPNYSED